jgi:hypothetical protein
MRKKQKTPEILNKNHNTSGSTASFLSFITYINPLFSSPAMKRGLDFNKLLFWTPRILGIAFCIILELFILLSHGFSIISLVENVFVMVLLIALVLAWRWPFPGGILYALLALSYIILAKPGKTTGTVLAMAIPLFIAGVLFILDHEFRAKKNKH